MSLKEPLFFAGQYRAVSFAYGVVPDVPGLEVDQPGSVGTITSTQTLSVACGTVTLQDGTILSPLAVNTQVIVGTGANADTVTVSAVSVGTPQIYQSANFTAATFTHAHGVGDRVSSATVGLQEAINYAASQGGGIVIVDAAWTQAGGTAAIFAAAVIPPTVSIDDTRNGLIASASNTVGAVAQLAAPTAVSTSAATYGLLTTAATGGTIPASGTYRLGVTYVDALGGETSLSIDTNALATIAVSAGSTNTISLTSPAALAGAVGYRVYMTAAAGGTLTEILYPVGNAAIVGTAASAAVLGPYGLPSFAIGTPVTINAIITGTAKVPAANTAYTDDSDCPRPGGQLSSVPGPGIHCRRRDGYAGKREPSGWIPEYHREVRSRQGHVLCDDQRHRRNGHDRTGAFVHRRRYIDHSVYCGISGNRRFDAHGQWGVRGAACDCCNRHIRHA